MKWSNLKQNICPQCNKKFSYSSFLRAGYIECGCGFAIRETRYSEIVNSQITKDLEDKWDKEVSETDL